MTYTILSKSNNSDGSIVTTVQFNVNNVISIQDINHAPGASLSDIILGITNNALVIQRNQQIQVNLSSILDSIVLNQETVI